MSAIFQKNTRGSALRRALCILFFFLAVYSTSAQKPEEALSTFLGSKAVDADHTAVYIWDLDADRLVVAHRQSSPVVPASVMKCVTTAALVSAYDYEDLLSTEVWLEGEQSGSLFKGSIVVKGSGDPSLGDGRFNGMGDLPAMIASALAERGITAIEGMIAVDNSLFAEPSTPDSWLKEDLSQAYGTGCHAFNFEKNATGNSAVTRPDDVFKRRLSAALSAAGVDFNEVSARPSRHKVMLLAYDSPLLVDLMGSCMFRSDNLYAETFLRLFGVKHGADGSPAASAAKATAHWKKSGLPMKDIVIADGSGLSRSNRLTAEFLGAVLKDMHEDPTYVSFFPLTGEEGTVKRFLKDTPLEAYMALKTGSMRGIQSYAGYMLDDDFRPTHVVVVMNDGLKDRAAFRAALCDLFLALFSSRQTEPDI